VKSRKKGFKKAGRGAKYKKETKIERSTEKSMEQGKGEGWKRSQLKRGGRLGWGSEERDKVPPSQ